MKSALRYVTGLGKADERLVPRKSFLVTNGSVKIYPVTTAVPNADALDFLFSLFKS